MSKTLGTLAVTSGKTQDVFQSGREDEPLDVFGSKGE